MTSLQDCKALQFLWVEVTNQCNLSCIHCYANSGPTARRAILSTDKYLDVISEAASLGCRRIQFIGGEPTLYRNLPTLIRHAGSSGMSFIEVYTNARRISDELMSILREYRVRVAVSFYSHDNAIHDAITQVPGSHSSTISNLRRFLEFGLETRVGIIEMPNNRDSIPETIEFLHSLGISECGTDRVRGVGRGKVFVENSEGELHELCGSCWQGSLCLASDGNVSPCIMSKLWSAGSILDFSLAELLDSSALSAIRQRVYEEVWVPNLTGSTTQIEAGGSPCTPTKTNCTPICSPRCSPSCSPCYPFGKCNPQLGL
jgi:MoaA/NifB/PqqE/SkfB family radical SAM enzyme